MQRNTCACKISGVLNCSLCGKSDRNIHSSPISAAASPVGEPRDEAARHMKFSDRHGCLGRLCSGDSHGLDCESSSGLTTPAVSVGERALEERRKLQEYLCSGDPYGPYPVSLPRDIAPVPDDAVNDDITHHATQSIVPLAPPARACGYVAVASSSSSTPVAAASSSSSIRATPSGGGQKRARVAPPRPRKTIQVEELPKYLDDEIERRRRDASYRVFDFEDTPVPNDSARYECPICMENSLRVRISPCGHCTCVACAKKAWGTAGRCATCAADIDGLLHIFVG